METLQQIAACFAVSLEEVLYGSGPALRRRRLARRTAIAAAVWITAGTLCNAALLLIANRLFWLESGLVTDGQREILRVRIALSNARDVVQAVTLSGFWLLCVVLTCFWIVCDPPVRWRRKAVWLAVSIAAPLLICLLAAALDGRMAVIDYWFAFIDVPLTGLLAVLNSAVGARIRARLYRT